MKYGVILNRVKHVSMKYGVILNRVKHVSMKYGVILNRVKHVSKGIHNNTSITLQIKLDFCPRLIVTYTYMEA